MNRRNLWAIRKLNRLLRTYGGPVDCHRHVDQDDSFDKQLYLDGQKNLDRKWILMDTLKSKPSYVLSLAQRIAEAIEYMMRQKIIACRTYIAVDDVIGLEGLFAAITVREVYREQAGFVLQIAAYPIRGCDTKQKRKLLERACKKTAGVKGADLLGLLPSRGRAHAADYKTSEKNMEKGFEIAYHFGKAIDLQIDQTNYPYERESEILCDVATKFRDKGYDYSIAATHCISLGSQNEKDIRNVARAFQKLGISVITCPHAAIDMRQDRHVLIPMHNSIAPVDILIDEGVTVGVGTDNVSDIYMPLVTGDLREEIRELGFAIRNQYDLELLAKIATVNGRKILGLPLEESKLNL